MVKEIRIYFEGDDQLRLGFHRLLSPIFGAELQKRRMTPIAANGDPVGVYKIALRKHGDAVNILLLDAEQQLDGSGFREQQLAEFPPERIFWMIELMESWFVADREALKGYYDDHRFQESALPGNPKVEMIPKKDVLDGLKNATRNTQKGHYHKTKHAPKILAMLDPDKVAKSAPGCRRFFDVLNQLVASVDD